MFQVKFCSSLRNLHEHFNSIRLRKTLSYTIFALQSNQSKGAAEVDALPKELEIDNDELEQEIERKRNKHRLPERVYRIHVEKETPTLILKYQFRKKRLRRQYGQYGKSSGLNPGILWPTKEELKDTIEYEKLHHPPLQEMLEKMNAEKLEQEQKKKDFEKEVEQNMANMEKWVQEHHAKRAKKEAAAEALRKKRELLIEEISEYLGYDVDPKDPKFKEAVEKREKEKKKALREKKEKESYAKMLQKLSEMAESSDKS